MADEPEVDAVDEPEDEQQQPDEEPKTGQPDQAKASLLKDLAGERSKRKALQARVDKLTAEATSSAELQTTNDALQRRVDRLEAVVLASDGVNLSKALDSRSFTTGLFETDTPVDKLLADWRKANPSAINQALGRQDDNPPADPKPSPGELIRAAIAAKR